MGAKNPIIPPMTGWDLYILYPAMVVIIKTTITIIAISRWSGDILD